MSSKWRSRKGRLLELLGCEGDEEEEGKILDRLLHGQAVIGKTQKTIELEGLRFSNSDVHSLGLLAAGQFGTIELVNCHIDGRVYVRKKTSKKTALKSQDQCSPLTEKQIFLCGVKKSSSWIPRMLCSYQCTDNLYIVMEYAEGGSLWDIVESSPNEGRVAISDLRWWVPQCVSAINWCHEQGFVHRDIKPHNFVLKPDGHLLLIDFGSAAPLLAPRADGVQLVAKKYCLVPCGTCDYISPEILKAHEEALVALEMSEDDSNDTPRVKNNHGSSFADDDRGYGREVDWWSLGAMIYEMAYGVAPFFARDVRQTYQRIMDHERSLKFNSTNVVVPKDLVTLLKGLLVQHDRRLGRHAVDQIRMQEFFRGVRWESIQSRIAPPDLFMPQFTYAGPGELQTDTTKDVSQTSSDSSRPYAFSGLFQSSVSSKYKDSPRLPSILQATPALGRRSFSAGSRSTPKASTFIGFSWGPTERAFDSNLAGGVVPTPIRSTHVYSAPGTLQTDHKPLANGLFTPMRPPVPAPTAMSTIRVARGPSSVQRSLQHRILSDREVMKQLVDCVGMSARKRVLESGKKPRILLSHLACNASDGGSLSLRSRSGSLSALPSKLPAYGTTTLRKELRFDGTAQKSRPNARRPVQEIFDFASGTEDSSTDGEVPPSPSPSPRPGSAMSMVSMSRRSVTPTISGSFPLLRANSEPQTATTTSFELNSSTNLLVTRNVAKSTSRPASQEAKRSVAGSTATLEEVLPDDLLDSLEKRHAKLSGDLSDIWERLERISERFGV